MSGSSPTRSIRALHVVFCASVRADGSRGIPGRVGEGRGGGGLCLTCWRQLCTCLADFAQDNPSCTANWPTSLPHAGALPHMSCTRACHNSIC
eukprot:292481-Chlamydomonas_euryale.AAC.5